MAKKGIKNTTCYFCINLKDCAGVALVDKTAAYCCEECFSKENVSYLSNWEHFQLDNTLRLC